MGTVVADCLGTRTHGRHRHFNRDEEVPHIIADARTRAEADAAQITATAQRSIESQQQQALVSLKGEVGVLATALAGKILGSKLESDDVQSTMIDQMIAELDSDKK